ncbi:hypothetical protein S40288_10954 [Stachybotrys chartarum IBT 40288]|nr:hypothetical protein S40288_10954 [Stachybotrys chartarum IBT 40288]
MATETVVTIKSILKPTRPVEVDWVDLPGSMVQQSSTLNRHVSDATTTASIPKKAAKRVTFPKVPSSVIVYEPLESESGSFSDDGDSDAGSEEGAETGFRKHVGKRSCNWEVYSDCTASDDEELGSPASRSDSISFTTASPARSNLPERKFIYRGVASDFTPPSYYDDHGRLGRALGESYTSFGSISRRLQANAKKGLVTSGSHIELRDEAKFRAGSTWQTGHRDFCAVSRRHYNHDALLSARITARDHLRINFAGVSVAPEVLSDFDISSTSRRCFETGAHDRYGGSKISPDPLVRHVNGAPLVEPSTMSPSFDVNLPVISPLDPMSLSMLPHLVMDAAGGLPETRYSPTSTLFSDVEEIISGEDDVQSCGREIAEQLDAIHVSSSLSFSFELKASGRVGNHQESDSDSEGELPPADLLVERSTRSTTKRSGMLEGFRKWLANAYGKLRLRHRGRAC